MCGPGLLLDHSATYDNPQKILAGMGPLVVIVLNYEFRLIMKTVSIHRLAGIPRYLPVLWGSADPIGQSADDGRPGRVRFLPAGVNQNQQ